MITFTFDLTRTHSDIPTKVTVHWEAKANVSDVSEYILPGSDLTISSPLPLVGGNYTVQLIIGDDDILVDQHSQTIFVTVPGVNLSNIKFFQSPLDSNVFPTFSSLIYSNRSDCSVSFDSQMVSIPSDISATATLLFSNQTVSQTVSSANGLFFSGLTTPSAYGSYPYMMTLSAGAYSDVVSDTITVAEIVISDLATLYKSPAGLEQITCVVNIQNGALEDEQITLSASFISQPVTQSLVIGQNVFSGIQMPSTAGTYTYTITVSNTFCTTQTLGNLVVVTTEISNVSVPIIQLDMPVPIQFTVSDLFGSESIVATISLAGSDVLISDIQPGVHTFTLDTSLCTIPQNYPLSITITDTTYTFASDIYSDILQVTQLIVSDVPQLFVSSNTQLSVPLNVRKINNTDDPSITVILDYLSDTNTFSNLSAGDSGAILNLSVAPPYGSYPFALTVIDNTTNFSDTISGTLYSVEIVLQNVTYSSDVDIIVKNSNITSDNVQIAIQTISNNIAINQNFGVSFDFNILFGVGITNT